MIQKIQLRRGTLSEWATVNPKLAAGEPGVELDSYSVKVGDGTNNWVDLPYVTGAGAAQDLLVDTSDTFQSYKIIALSNGTVKAIPASAVPPAIPLPSLVARLSSVLLTWPAAARATSYAILRDGVQIANPSFLSYRDIAITVGATYVYRLQSIDQYGQRSTLSNPLNAFIDPALNVPPQVQIRSYPEALPTVGKAFIRVNASDVNAQSLALALNATVGTLEATDDPSLWLYTAP